MLLVLVAGRAAAQEGGIEVFAGETLFSSGWRASITEIYKRRGSLYRGSNTVADPLDRTLVESRTVLGVDHGVLPDVTLTALAPVVHRELESGGSRVRATGIGDLALLGKYRLVKEEWKQGGFNWSMIGGLEMPTGRTGIVDDGTLLAPGMQPGTGAWNPFIATAVNLGIGRARFDTSLFYKLNTEGAQGYEAGDFFTLRLAAAYRFIHVKYPGPTVGARIGLHWRHEERAEQRGAMVGDSGADEVLLGAGIVVHPRPDIDLNFEVDVPIYEDYEGQQLGRDVIVSMSFGIRF